MIPPLNAFIKSTRTIIGFDPGETTGFAKFRGTSLVEATQLQTKTLSSEALHQIYMQVSQPDVDEVVIEDYRVYGWKTEEHSFTGLHTPKLIGMIITVCLQEQRPYTLRMAQPAKAFVTDEKLEAWGLFDKGQRHSRDAMRHALFQMIFNKKDESKD